jgi:GTP-binding protein
VKFIDECTLTVHAGTGGNGCAAFRREKFVPFGGPAGGDGGRGGDVVLIADTGVNTLYELTHVSTVRAAHGGPGQGKDCYGRGAEDSELRVPVGTVVYDATTREKLCELVRADERFVVATGGRGGRGNKHFATPTDRAPRKYEKGEPGQVRELRLELRVMADVGLLGFPNVGKSTLISAVSRARPKVADYPFTTLVPHLGVVTIGDSRAGLGRSFVVADIPGLIPGASEGAGLGIRFLRHLERTRVLLHLIALAEEPGRNPIDDYHVIRRELLTFNPDLAGRPEVVALTKADLPDVVEAYPALAEDFKKLGVNLRLVSAATHHGLTELMQELSEQLFI